MSVPGRPVGAGSMRAWKCIGLAVLVLGTAAMYLGNIAINGMGNKFYAAAAWAGSHNWESLLFGSLDPRNVITVDKPPGAKWVMGMSGQIPVRLGQVRRSSRMRPADERARFGIDEQLGTSASANHLP
jgi:hypothetical protein